MPAPGKTTLTMGLPPIASATGAGQRAAGRAAGGALQGRGGDGKSGPDLTLDPAHDGERTARDQTWIDGRPVHDETGWGTPLASCHGIPAFKNVIDSQEDRDKVTTAFSLPQEEDPYGLCLQTETGYAYQCVEFVTRYYRDALGVTGVSDGDGGTYLHGSRGGLAVHRFPTPTRPQAGDLMVKEGSPGHVAIVESVTGDDSALTVTVVQQNTKSAREAVSITPTHGAGMMAPGGDLRPMRMYNAGDGWSGFRRKADVAPTAATGGSSASVWADRKPDHGMGNYVVKPGESTHVSDVARIHDLTDDEVRALNPFIDNAIVGPAEVRVSGAPTFREPAIGQAAVAYAGSIRAKPKSNAAHPANASSVEVGDVLQVFEVVDGEDKSGNKRWYRIGIFSNQHAYVHSGLCSGGPP